VGNDEYDSPPFEEEGGFQEEPEEDWGGRAGPIRPAVVTVMDLIDGNANIDMKVTLPDGHLRSYGGTIYFKLRRVTLMYKLMDAFCQRCGLPRDRVVFTLAAPDGQGALINATDDAECIRRKYIRQQRGMRMAPVR
jgi:hypothetical protein